MYDYGPVVHVLSVEGNLSTEAARLLLDCEEAVHKLGFVTKLQISITRETPPAKLTATEAAVALSQFQFT